MSAKPIVKEVVVNGDLKRFFGQLDQLRDMVLNGAVEPFALREPLQNVIEKRATFPLKALAGGPFIVKAKYGYDISKQVEAGNFDSHHDGFETDYWMYPYNDEPKRRSTEKVELLLFDLGAYPEEEWDIPKLFRLLTSLGLRAAKVEQLLAFGAQCREVSSSRSIIACGTYHRRIYEEYWGQREVAAPGIRLAGGQRQLIFRRGRDITSKDDLLLVERV
jgi:hypothetical protein